jgi:hydrogenase small subunit
MKQNHSNYLKLAASLKVCFGIDNLPESVEGLIRSIKNADIPPIIYLKGKTCTGCSVSLIKFTKQSTAKLIVNNDNLMLPKGDISPYNIAVDLIRRYTSGQIGPYFFAMEGAIPKNPIECYMANRPINDWVKRAGDTCIMAISIGNCTIYGNPNIQQPVRSDNMSLADFFNQQNINKEIFQVPGCPVNDHSIWTLIVDLVKTEFPELKIATDHPKVPAEKNWQTH